MIPVPAAAAKNLKNVVGNSKANAAESRLAKNRRRRYFSLPDIPSPVGFQANQSEPKVGETIAGTDSETKGRPAISGVAVPGAAPEHPLDAEWRSLWIFDAAGGIRAITIQAPLEDIADHVMQTESVLLVEAHRRREDIPIRTGMQPHPFGKFRFHPLIRDIGIVAGTARILPPVPCP